MEWVEMMFRVPVGHELILAKHREPGQYALFWDTLPTYSDIVRSEVVVSVRVTQRIVVDRTEREE